MHNASSPCRIMNIILECLNALKDRVRKSACVRTCTCAH